MPETGKDPAPYISVPGGLPGEDPAKQFRYLNFMIHSPGGHGKTTLLSTACDDPRTSPILVVDYEGGAPLRFVGKDPTKFTLKRVRNINTLNEIYEYLRKGDHPYKSVALDSVTELQKLGLFEFVYGRTPDKTFQGNVINIKTAEIQHWGQSKTQVEMLLRYFRDLPMHTFFTCMTSTTKDEQTGKVTTTVALPAKTAEEAPGIPDIVGYLDVIDFKNPQTGVVEKGTRVLKVQPDGRVVAKDRTDALGDGILNPTVTKILDLIYAKYHIVA